MLFLSSATSDLFVLEAGAVSVCESSSRCSLSLLMPHDRGYGLFVL